MHTRRLAALSLPLLLAGVIAAQGKLPLFKLSQRGNIIPPNREASIILVGDFNGDKKPDLFMNTGNAQNRLFLGNGKGGFEEVTDTHLPVRKDTIPYKGQGPDAADLDGDGDLDLVFAQDNVYALNQGPAFIWLNDGKARFSPAPAGNLPSIKAECVKAADVDGDKDLDLIVGTPGTRNGLLLNDGTGKFTDVSTTNMPADTDFSHAMAVADVDGDKDLDVIFGNWDISQGSSKGNQADRLYLNDGTGRFTNAPAGRFPGDPTFTLGLTAGDVDGDGDQDLVRTHCTYCAGTKQHELFLNNGSGRFTPATTGFPKVTDTSYSVLLIDLDKDGDLDLFFPKYDRMGLYLNDGKGHFTDITAKSLPADTIVTRTAAFADFDRDGDLDLVANTSFQVRYFENNGRLRFTNPVEDWLPRTNHAPEHAVLGDVDGDGHPDLVMANTGVFSYTSEADTIYLNDGHGRFFDATQGRLPAAGNSGYSSYANLADLDGDRDLDLVMIKDGDPCRLYLNDGKGYFTDVTATNLPAITTVGWGAKVFDADGDGDLDLFIAVGFAPNMLLLNDGKARFTDVTTTHMPALSAPTRRGVAGDLDGDGDQDLVIGNYTDQNRIYLNDGTGRFTDATAGNLVTRKDNTMDLVLLDADGDGDLDLYVTNGYRGQLQDHLYLNDGKGRFTDVTATNLSMPLNESMGLAVADFDLDGDPDILLGETEDLYDEGRRNAVLINDGKGRFTFAHATAEIIRDHTNSVAAGDVDLDGDIDVVSVNAFSPLLYLNLSRQVWAPESPRAGRRYTIETWSRPAGKPERRWTLTMIASRPAHAWTPYGILGLNMWSTVFADWQLTRRNEAVAQTSWRIPRLACWVGLKRFYVQALVEVGSRGWWKKWHYTNTLEEKTRP